MELIELDLPMLALATSATVLGLGLGRLAVALRMHLAHWQRGRAVPLRLRDVLAVPRRYLHDVHEVVAREPASARMHASLAGGILLTLVVFTVTLAFAPSWLGAGTVCVCTLLALPGLWLEHQRRRAAAPGRSAGSYDTLPLRFAALLAGLSGLAIARQFDAPLLLAVSAMAAGWALWQLADMAARGPMRHAVAGLAYLAAHPRPERFGPGGHSVGLKSLDPSLDGVAAPSAFTVPQLVGFDACVQCGRCETACPAFAAGLPLNPKKFVNDLAAASRGAAEYSGNPHPGLGTDLPAETPILVGTGGFAALRPETIWSCTTCRACVEACPMMIEHVDAMIDLRRGEVLGKGAIAAQARVALEQLRETDTISGLSPTRRFDWAVDLDLPLIRDDTTVDLLLWVGESAFDRRAQRVLRALVLLLRRANVSFAILGEDERDCGDTARRLGDEETFAALARVNVETLSRYRFGAIVTADPHVMNALRNDYPAFGGNWSVRHHSEVLAELLATGHLPTPIPAGRAITWHDPCYLGRWNGEYTAPRAVLNAMGFELIEMERSGSNSHCCGGGGGAPLTDIAGERRIPDMRMAQVAKTGARCVAVGCPGCATMLEGVPQAQAEVHDLAELLLERLEAA